MIQESMAPPDEVMIKVLRASRQIATILPREALQDVCPVCSRPIIVRDGHAMCVSGLCRGRIIEDCC